MRKLLFATVVAGLAVPSLAIAQEGTVTGAAGGAAAGAVIGGPVGAVIGGVGGAVVGTILAPPPAEVRSYVVQEEIPSVAVQEEIVVGEALPEVVEIRRVPQYDSYGYAVVNEQRVIVDPRSRKVIEVLR
jgi:Protein of unknown function (DUF1236)